VQCYQQALPISLLINPHMFPYLVNPTKIGAMLVNRLIIDYASAYYYAVSNLYVHLIPSV